MDFYDRADKAFAIVQCVGERRPYVANKRRLSRINFVLLFLTGRYANQVRQRRAEEGREYSFDFLT